MIERHGPNGECPRCEAGQRPHSKKCRLRFEKARAHETELRTSGDISPATITSTTSNDICTDIGTCNDHEQLDSGCEDISD